VCRHRAYTITKKASGSSTVLGCRYHGWSYNTQGNLVKAPEFEGIPGFDKKLNGLFEIRTRVTDGGCVFVNFDASEVVPGFDFERLRTLREWNVGSSRWVSGWTLEGDFNWKVAECVKDVPAFGDEMISSRWSSVFPIFRRQANQKALDLFPGTEFHLSPYGKVWISARYIPKSANKTTILIDLYALIPKTNQSSTKLENLENCLRSYFHDRVRQLEQKHTAFIQNDPQQKNCERLFLGRPITPVDIEQLPNKMLSTHCW